AKLASAAGADFEAPLRNPAPPKEEEPKQRVQRRPAGQRRGERRGGDAGRRRGGFRPGAPRPPKPGQQGHPRPGGPQALFCTLAHGHGERRKGARVLDLFAGTGALGIEALSRGAAYALFVEEGVEARGLIRTNIDSLGLTGRSRVFRRDATRLGEAGTVAPFD